MRINSDGNVALAKNIGLGGATPTTSGTGITFPATASASTDGNTLDDYEEGTWTPTITNFTLGNGTLANNKYVKIGKLVILSFNIFWGSTTTATGGMNIGGLPFASGSSGNGSAWLFDNSAVVQYRWSAVIPSSTSNDFQAGNNTTILSNTSPFTWAIDDRINFSGTYQT